LALAFNGFGCKDFFKFAPWLASLDRKVKYG
jgi:hypothetical protein